MSASPERWERRRDPDGKFTRVALQDVQHGTKAGYVWETLHGTPCPACRAAQADYMRSLRLRQGTTTSVLVPVAIVRRMIQDTKDRTLAIQLASLLPKDAS